MTACGASASTTQQPTGGQTTRGSRDKSGKLVGRRNQPESTGNGRNPNIDKWITLFEDQITTCETVGVELPEEAKYYMNLSTRTLYLYGQISTHKPHLVFKVIRGEEGKPHGEASFKAEEKGCHICGGGGHFWKSCRFYNDKFTLEKNQRWFKKKRKADSTDDHKSTEGKPRGGASPTGVGGATVKKGAANKAPRSSGGTQPPQSEEKSEQRPRWLERLTQPA